MQTPAQRADTESGSFHSGFTLLTRGELAACTFLFLGIPLLLLWSVRLNAPPASNFEIQVRSASAPLHSNTESARLNLNQASTMALELLPGIGPVRARKIVAFREAHGPFKSVQDLAGVPGIPKSLLSQIESLVTVQTP